MRSNELVGHGLVVMTEVGDLKTTSDQSLTLFDKFLSCLPSQKSICVEEGVNDNEE